MADFDIVWPAGEPERSVRRPLRLQPQLYRRRRAMAVDEHHDGCEWNPDKQCAVWSDERHFLENVASTIVGKGKWRLCAACAGLQYFDRYKDRKQIAK